MKLLKVYFVLVTTAITIMTGCSVSLKIETTKTARGQEPITSPENNAENTIVNPKKERNYYQKAMAHYDSANYQQAEIYYTKAIEAKPDPLIYYSRAKTRYKLKKFLVALEDYNRAIELNPGYAVAYLNRGVIYHREEKVDLALSDYNRAIQLHPYYANAYYNRALLNHYERQKFDLALSDYNRAIELHPGYADAYKNRGKLYKRMGQKDLARDSWLKAGKFYQKQERIVDYQETVNLIRNIEH